MVLTYAIVLIFALLTIFFTCEDYKKGKAAKRLCVITCVLEGIVSVLAVMMIILLWR